MIRRYSFATTFRGSTKEMAEEPVPYRYYIYHPPGPEPPSLEKITKEEAERRIFTEFLGSKVPSDFVSVQVPKFQE